MHTKISNNTFQSVFRLQNSLSLKTLLFISALLLQAEVFANAVGVVPGNFSVSPSGSASYSIPIEVPKGINGMQPELALVYDSQSGNGLLGMGWGLSGLSAITRCPKNYAQDDNQIHGVDFTTADRLCLDGQRLVLKNGNNDDVSYWAANAEYRTEINSFSKITRVNDSYFTVETKDGRVTEYGNDGGGNNAIQNVKTINYEDVVVVEELSWAVSGITDQHGNTINYFYDEDVDNGDYRISSIEYAGNASASIQFSYDTQRPDPVTGYFAGAKVSTLGRLSSIATQVGPTLVKEYQLTFDQSVQTQRSTIVNISMCDGATPQNCMPASQFGWSGTVPSFEIPGQPELPTNAAGGAATYSESGARTWIADVNGDGLSDYMWLPYGRSEIWVAKSNGTEYALPEKWLKTNEAGVASYSAKGQTWIVDVDGDGLSDYMWMPYGRSDIWVAKSTGTGFEIPTKPEIASKAANGAHSYSESGARTWIVDINGDGLSDYMWLPYAGSEIWVAKSNGTGYALPEKWLKTNEAGVPSYSGHGQSWIADVNGDGLSDYLWLPYGKFDIWVAKSTGTEFAPPEKWLPNGFAGAGIYSHSDGGDNTWIADVNGDGLSDYMWKPSGQVYDIWVAKSKGTGFEKPEMWLPRNAAGSGIYSHSDGGDNTWIVDVNGDGLSDYMWKPSGRNDIWVAKSTHAGEPVVEPEPWLAANAAGVSSTSQYGWYTWIVDFDGDGLSDYMWMPYGLGEIWVAKSLGTPIDAVEKITNGLSANIDISYQPLTNNSIYTKDVDVDGYPIHAYPVTDFQGAVQVVTSASTDNALGTQNSNTYEYGGMKIHKKGRGSLGFRWTESTDQETGIKTRHEYRQVRLDINAEPEPDFPFVENVVSAEKSLSNGKIINRLDNFLTETTGYPTSPYVSQSISTEYDLDHAINGVVTKISTVQKDRLLDDFGNPTYEKTTSTEPDLSTHVVEVIRGFNTYGSSPCERSQVITEASISTGGIGLPITNNRSYEYNTDCQLLTKTREPGKPAYELVTSYGYDALGNRTSVTVDGADIEARSSTTYYDINGRFPEVAKNAFNHTVTSTFDPDLGVALSTIDASGLITTQSYDGFARQTNTISPNGTMVSTIRSWCTTPDCVVSAIDTGLLPQQISFSVKTRFLGSDGVTEYKPSIIKYFDKLGREVRSETTGFNGETLYQDTNYDALGRVAATTQIYDVAIGNKNPTLNTNYDLLGRLRQQTSPENGTTVINYSSLITTTSNNGRTKKETSNTIGQLLAAEDAMNQVQSYQYNALGKRIKTTDSMGNVLTVAYDDIGRKISMDDPDMGHWNYSYDVLGQLKTQTDAKAQTTSIEYDRLGRKIRRLDHDGTETIWDYVDDMTAGGSVHIGIGRLDNELIKSPTNPNFDQYKAYSYNAYGQPAQVLTAFMFDVYNTYSVNTTYDDYGRVATVTYPSSTDGASATGDKYRFKVKYGYLNGYLKRVDNIEGTKNYWIADDRNAKGQLTLMTHGNNVVTSHAYDNAGRKTSINVGNVASYFSGQYAYDSVGNLDSSDIFHGVGSQVAVTENYGYDLLNRLTSVNSTATGVSSYQYDGLGNITSKDGKTYLYQGTPHAVTKVGTDVYGYDLNGNMISGLGRSTSWSAFNKPVQIENSNARLNFRYGTDRSRYQQTKLDTSTGNTDTITYIGGLFEVVEKPTLTEYKHFIKAGGGTVAVNTRRSNSTNETTYLHKDKLGSLVVVTDDLGASKADFSYDAFGKRRPVDGEASINPLMLEYTRGFTNHESLTDVGLIHMNGRVYDPALGRFISADPFIQFSTNMQSYNRYSYVLNNPLGYTDPSGYFLSSKTKNKIKKVSAVSAVVGTAFAHPSVALSALTIKHPNPAYSKPVINFQLKHKWARVGGQIVAGVADGISGCTGCFSAAYSAYITDISGGSSSDVLKAAAITWAVAYVAHNYLDDMAVDNGFATKGEWADSMASEYYKDGATTAAGREKIKDLLRKKTIAAVNGFVAERYGISNVVGLYGALTGDGFNEFAKGWAVGKVKANVARGFDSRGMGTYASGLVAGYLTGGIAYGYEKSFQNYAYDNVKEVSGNWAKDYAIDVYFANGGANFGRQIGEGWQSHHSSFDELREQF